VVHRHFVADVVLLAVERTNEGGRRLWHVVEVVLETANFTTQFLEILFSLFVTTLAPFSFEVSTTE